MNNNHHLGSWQVTYSDDYDETVGNILKVTPDFLRILDNNEFIIIQGNEEDDFLFSIESNSYKLRDIFLPSTMLLAPKLTEKQQNGAQGNHDNNVAYVNLQTAHYLKLEPHSIEYEVIYCELMKEEVNKQAFQETNKLWDLIISSSFTVKAVCDRFRLTHSQLEQLLKFSPIIVLHRTDFPNMEEPSLIVFGLDALLSAMRHLLPFLIEQDLIGSWFDYSQILSLGVIKHEKILHLLAKFFQFDIDGSLDLSYTISEPMQVEQVKTTKYKCKVETIVRFVLLEHALAKKQYSTIEMDASVWNLTLTYLPIGLSQFQEPKAKKAIQQLIGFYFLTVPKPPTAIRLYYDPLLIGSSIKDRLEFLRIYKKKFALTELQGVFISMIKNQMDLSDILMKHFRKCGQQYQLKLVIPK